MKAEMSADGVLTIYPENPTECYAINQWAKESWVEQKDITHGENGHIRGSKLIISHVQKENQ